MGRFSKSWRLVGTNEVHSPDEGGFVSGGAHGMRPGGDGGTEDVVVGPDKVGRGALGGHEGHAAGDAEGRGAVGIVEAHPLFGQPVE